MSAPSVHDDWLSLIEISGPFLAVPVLKEAFPQGLEELDTTKRKRLRQAYEEWREALELEDTQFAELHAAWIDEVLSRGLEFDVDGKGDVLKRADWCAVNLQASLPEHGVTLSPALAVVDEQRVNKPLLLIQVYAQDVDLDANLKQDGWAATPADRMVQLCRSLGCRLGLVTNGERWMMVDAPVGAVTTFASWYARIWSQEPITLQAFVHLLGIRRFFVDESEQLPALLDRSLKFQDEVTDALGEQVRRAVEVLIQTLDKADQDRNRELLHDVKEPELYEAALTVMMRLVFLLSAEERGLLLMGDERYEANYALSTLRMQLRKESEEILERRWDAWSRLLAIFRAVFGGIEHENLRLPALGGSLFDPDRFPFLEGRAKGSNWRSDAAKPLPIDNRTVLLLLEAIQQFQGRTLSYRALDVEQIGYVYEGLLERTVKRTDEVTLELDATKSAKTPWVKLAKLDSARLEGAARLAELLQERSGSSASRVRNDLAKPVDDTLADRLLTACQGDTKLRDRVKPYAHLLRTDPWGYPLVYPAGASLSEADIQHLKKSYPNSSYKLINSFKFFIERMDQITASAAKTYSFLVPSSLLEHIGCRDSRALLLSRSPIMFIDCGDGMFTGVTQSCCFGVITKRAASEVHPVVLGTFQGYCKTETTRQHSDWTVKTIQEIRGRKNSVLSHGADVKHINSGPSMPLIELADVFDSGIDYSRAALGGAVFYSEQAAENPSDYKVLRGRNIGKFWLEFDGIWLRNNWRDIQQEHIAIDSKSRLKVNEKAYVISPKILVRQTGDQIIATVDTDRFFHQKSLLCIIPKAGVSAYFLCAILNHPKMTEIYRGMTMQSGKVFSQVKKNFLEQLPIPSSFDLSQKERIAALAEKLIKTHDQDDKAKLLIQLENEVVKGFVEREAVIGAFDD